jgi:hypothetical protein
VLRMKTGEFAGGAKTSKVLLNLLEHVPGVRDPHSHHLSQQQHCIVPYSETYGELRKT